MCSEKYFAMNVKGTRLEITQKYDVTKGVITTLTLTDDDTAVISIIESLAKQGIIPVEYIRHRLEEILMMESF